MRSLILGVYQEALTSNLSMKIIIW